MRSKIFTTVLFFVFTASTLFAQITPADDWKNLSAEIDPNNTAGSLFPEQAISGNTIHIVWIEFHQDSSYNRSLHLYYRRSPDKGVTWEAPKMLYQFTENSIGNLQPSYPPTARWLSVEGDTVHIAFCDRVNNNRTLHYINSTDGGDTFSAPLELVNQTANNADGFIIRTAGSKVAIAYDYHSTNVSERGIRVVFSLDNGLSFNDSLAVPINSYGSNSHDGLVDFSYDGQQMLFLSHQNTSLYGGLRGKVYASVSNNNCDTVIHHKLSVPDSLGVEYSVVYWRERTTLQHYIPHIARSGNYIHIVFEQRILDDDNYNRWRTVYVRSTDYGATFEERRILDDTKDAINPTQKSPVIAVKNDKVYILQYQRISNVFTLSLKTSSDNGATFTPVSDVLAGRLNFGITTPRSYAILIDEQDVTGNTIHITGDHFIYGFSRDGGATFENFLLSPVKISNDIIATDLLIDDDGTRHFFIAPLYSGPGYTSYKNSDIFHYAMKPQPEPGNENKAFQIAQSSNGLRTALVVPASPSLAIDSAVTVEVWAKFRMPQIVSFPLVGRTSGTSGYFFQGFGLIATNQSGNGYMGMRAELNTDNGVHIISPYNRGNHISDTLWHHVVMTYDMNNPTENFILYVDGMVVEKKTAIGVIDAGNGIYQIGDVDNTYSKDYQLDEVRIWNRALTQQEVLENMKRTDFSNEENLRLYLNFDDTFKDISGNGNDAIPMAATTLTPSHFNPPTADFDVYQVANDISCIDKTQNGRAIKYHFGDNNYYNTSTLSNPTYHYNTPGEYNILMSAANANSVVATMQQISIQGIDHISPVKAGNRGYVMIDIFGGGVTQNTTIILYKTGEENRTSDTTIVFNSSHVRVRINVDNAGLGDWNIKVKQGTTEHLLTQTFQIEQARYPETNVSIAGRDLVLLNRFQTYTINYSNTGNSDAYSVPLTLIMDEHENMVVEFVDFIVDLPIAFYDHPQADYVRGEGVCFTIDTLDGQARKVRVYPLLIPEIRANSTGSITIRIKSPADYRFEARIEDPWVVFDSEDMPGGGSTLAASKANGLETAECLIEILAEGVIEHTVDLIPMVGCVNSIRKQTVGYYRAATGKSTLGSAIWNNILGASNCVGELVFPLKLVTFTLGWATTIYELKDCAGNYKKDEKNIHTVASIDPNEIIGANGYGDENWTQPLSEIPYVVFFENRSNATAPAHEVFITDTLDSTKFDLSCFSFGSYGWGDTVILQEEGVIREFSHDVDLRPEKELIVRISGKLDTVNSVVKVDFISLNPTTMEEEEDPMIGFLPPNDENHEGEGFVSFSIGIKPITATGQTIENRACIVFDANEPIITNEYVNTFDLDKPQSNINSLFIENDNIALSWDGTDVGSGVAYYDIWMQKDDEPWQALCFHSTETSATIPVVSGDVATYKFYCISTDNTYWVQEIPDEYQTINTNIKNRTDQRLWTIYPNPAGGQLYIANYELSDGETINVIDALGKTVISSPKTVLDISGLPQGIYFLRIGNHTAKFMKR